MPQSWLTGLDVGLGDINLWLLNLFGMVKLPWLKPYRTAHDGVISVAVSTVVGFGSKKICQEGPSSKNEI